MPGLALSDATIRGWLCTNDALVKENIFWKSMKTPIESNVTNPMPPQSVTSYPIMTNAL
ncbi:MAG: hypothetical protein K0S98_1512 [Propionibacteriaceae bacterium]|jgi:hypothetical protein|nr:hypothetical protein [Propionibacteriaceae bacterium]